MISRASATSGFFDGDGYVVRAAWRVWRGRTTRFCSQTPPPGLSPLVEQAGCFTQSGGHSARLRAVETVSFQLAL